MDDEDDADMPSAGGSTWRSAGDYSTKLQLNADEESQFSAFSSGHSATIFVLDASTDMLRTQLAGTNESKSAFQWGLTAVLASVRQLVFSNRNDHVGLVFFGCRQQPQLLEAEEFSDDSDELVMRTAHTVMYLHKAGLDTMRALYKLSKVDEDKIERQCESLTPGDSGSVRINVGEALWKTHRMLEYANQWFAAKRVVILTNSDDPHGLGQANGGSKNKSKSSDSELTQKFTCDRASRLHEAGTEVFVVPFKLAADDKFDMRALYDNVQKISTKAMKGKTLESSSCMQISPDNVDDIDNLIHTLVESPIIKRPLCTLPLRLSSKCALQLAVYHPIAKFTKLPLLWLKSTRKSGANGAASTGNDGTASNANQDGDGDDDDDDDNGGGGDADQRMDVIKRRRVFVDPSDSSIIPKDEIKKRLFVMGREMIFSNEEAKSWKEFGIPPGMEVLASVPVHLAQRFIWKNYIKPTLFATVKLTGEVQDQKATLKVFRSLIEACRAQSRALIVRYTPPPRLGTTRIALLVPDILPTSTTTPKYDDVKNSKHSQTSTQAAISTSSSGFQMFLVPYIQELRDIVDKLYERTTDDVLTLTNSSSATQTQLVKKYVELAEALRDDWTPQKYYNPAVYNYYLKLEAQVCKWPTSEIPKELDDPSMPDYDDMEARAGPIIERLKASAITTQTQATTRGGRKQGARARGGRRASVKEKDEKTQSVEEPPTAAKRGGGRTKQVARRNIQSTRGRGGRSRTASSPVKEEDEDAEPDEEEAPAATQGGRTKQTRGRGGRGSRASASPSKETAEVDEEDETPAVSRGGRTKQTRRGGRGSRASASPSKEDAEPDEEEAPAATQGGRTKQTRGRGGRSTRASASPSKENSEVDEEDTPAVRRGGRTKQVARRTTTRGRRRGGRASAASENREDEDERMDDAEEDASTQPVKKPTKRARK